MISPFQNVIDALKRADLVGAGADQVVPEGWMPTTLLQIDWLDTGKSTMLGNYIKPVDTSSLPQVSFVGENPLEPEQPTYTIIFIDVDAKQVKEEYGTVRHWVATGLTPASINEQSAATENGKPLVEHNGDTLTEYIGSKAPPQTGLHRYVFLLCKENKGRPATEQATIQSNELMGRAAFDTKAFLEHNGLEVVGANFFTASGDNNDD